MSFGRPAWSPAAADGISWPSTSPLRRGGTDTAGIRQIVAELSKWHQYPAAGSVDLPPDTPLAAAYLASLLSEIDDARDHLHLDAWSWQHSDANPPTDDLLTELRRAAPLSNPSTGNTLRGKIVEVRNDVSASTLYLNTRDYVLASRHGLNTSSFVRGIIRAVERYDFAEGERAEDGSMSIYVPAGFVRGRTSSGVDLPPWPELSVRLVSDAAMPEDSDYDWDDTDAADLWALMASSPEIASAARADLVSPSDSVGSNQEETTGHLHLSLPDVTGSARVWLAYILQSDTASIPDYTYQWVSTPSAQPRLFWSESIPI